MKNTIIMIGAFFCLLGAASAQVNTKGGAPATTPRASVQLSGTFDSKRGIMHDISCYGFNIGFLSTTEAKYVVCFDRLPNGSDIDVNCNEDQVWVEGYFETKEAPSGGPCSAGTREIFYVTKWHCQ
ncbi:MAG: hypothetical protein IBJ09_11060 [Bacteroidia bacterium]|nr:hypothetical protein [Bacteroidia bacterium]